MATLKYRYLQTGEFFQGVPARDLTDEDWDGLDPEAREAVAGSAIYREATAKEQAAAAKEQAAAAKAQAQAAKAGASATPPADAPPAEPPSEPPATPPADDSTTG